MNEVIKVFKQQANHDIAGLGIFDVSIHRGAIVSVGHSESAAVGTPREEALAWIILRLNAQVISLQQQLDEAKKMLDEKPKA